MTRGYGYQVLQWLDKGFSTFSRDKVKLYPLQWQRDLDLRSPTWGQINFPTHIWLRSRNCGCLVIWFCYQLTAKPGNKTVAVPWPDPYISIMMFEGNILNGFPWMSRSQCIPCSVGIWPKTSPQLPGVTWWLDKSCIRIILLKKMMSGSESEKTKPVTGCELHLAMHISY